jgi:hypothetical protein
MELIIELSYYVLIKHKDNKKLVKYTIKSN